mgnify:CR=1 FL=1
MRNFNTLLKPSSWMLGLASCLTMSLTAAPPVINDAELTKDLGDQIGAFVSDKKTRHTKELSKQLARKSVALALPKALKDSLKDIYSDRVGSVGIIASVYKCKKCPNWHRSGCATCWILTEDGVMVTNYHVFEGRSHDGFGVLTTDGKVAPVTEILAASKEDDIAIFRVDGAGYKPIPLGDAQKVGGEAHIIAHPDSRFFTYTGGEVSRYYRDRNKRDCYWMGVTAEYARGSSGGPVMDEAGNIIGMVSSTNSIYYPPRKPGDKKGPFQMVIRNCVPVDQIRKLITKPEASAKK